MKNGDHDSSKAALAIAAILLLLPLGVVVRLFCLSKVYAWHVQPVFGGPTLSMGQWWGLGMFAFLFYPRSSNSKDTKEEPSELVPTVIGLHGRCCSRCCVVYPMTRLTWRNLDVDRSRHRRAVLRPALKVVRSSCHPIIRRCSRAGTMEITPGARARVTEPGMSVHHAEVNTREADFNFAKDNTCTSRTRHAGCARSSSSTRGSSGSRHQYRDLSRSLAGRIKTRTLEEAIARIDMDKATKA